MTKAELESKHLAELHVLAAEAEVPRYRMLRREELIEKLSDGETPAERPPEKERSRDRSEPSRQRRRGGRDGRSSERSQRQERPQRERPERRERSQRREREQRPKAEAPPPPKREESDEATAPAEPRRSRRRSRRRFGRKRKELRLHDLLAGAAPARQTIVYAETREACTAMLRELAAGLAGASGGPDPVVLLADPGPEELAEWRRVAPQAEIVAAAQARHAEDALAQAVRRAESGEETIVLIDSLTRLAELGNADDAKGLLNAAGSLAVVAALEQR